MVKPILDERCDLAFSVPREPVGRVVSGGSHAFQLPAAKWPIAGAIEATCRGPTRLDSRPKFGRCNAIVNRFRHAFYSRPRLVVYVSWDCVSRFSRKTLTRPSTPQSAKNHQPNQSTSGAIWQGTTGTPSLRTPIRNGPLKRSPIRFDRNDTRGTYTTNTIKH